MSKFKDWPLSTMTEQEVFDFVAAHLIKQGRQSSFGYQCLYKTRDIAATLKCAAGCLIPDKHYSESMEGDTWGQLVDENVVPASHAELIKELQLIHDWDADEYWPVSLEALANNRGLNTKVLAL